MNNDTMTKPPGNATNDTTSIEKVNNGINLFLKALYKHVFVLITFSLPENIYTIKLILRAVLQLMHEGRRARVYKL